MDSRYLQLRNALLPIYGETESRALALIIFEDGFGVSPVDIYADKVRNFSEEENRRYEDILRRMQRDEPMQHVLGSARFCGMDFRVTPATLIPRPETEELVEWVVSENADRPLRLLDGGTGTGCIAISLAKRLPLSAVEAWDISAEALAVAEENARSLDAKVRFRHADLLHPPSVEASFDLIVSNPPYVCEHEKSTMSPHVLLHEPATALFVPDDDPLRFYRALADLARRSLAPGGKIYMEINSALGAETLALFEQSDFSCVELRRDMFGKDRMVRAVKI